MTSARTPQVRNPAMAHALWLAQQVYRYSAPEPCNLPWSSSRFSQGSCLVAWGFSDMLKLSRVR